MLGTTLALAMRDYNWTTDPCMLAERKENILTLEANICLQGYHGPKNCSKQLAILLQHPRALSLNLIHTFTPF